MILRFLWNVCCSLTSLSMKQHPFHTKQKMTCSLYLGIKMWQICNSCKVQAAVPEGEFCEELHSCAFFIFCEIYVVSLTRYKLQFQKESKKELAESRERAHNPIEVKLFYFFCGSRQSNWGEFFVWLETIQLRWIFCVVGDNPIEVNFLCGSRQPNWGELSITEPFFVFPLFSH